ncbi:MAG: hypothetical protein VKJ24_05905 [Synechococcales bacterium]|nr:hypothetical protein [Synechococcales bacterium]
MKHPHLPPEASHLLQEIFGAEVLSALFYSQLADQFPAEPSANLATLTEFFQTQAEVSRQRVAQVETWLETLQKRGRFPLRVIAQPPASSLQESLKSCFQQELNILNLYRDLIRMLGASEPPQKYAQLMLSKAR